MSRSPRKPFWKPATTMRLILLVLLTFTSACSSPSRATQVATGTAASKEAQAQGVNPSPAAPSPRPTQQPLPPALVESDPPQGSEIPLDRFITLYFNQAMDRASVEDAMQVGSFLVGDLTWSDDRTMTINPGAALPASSEISIDIETGARSASGLQLPQPINLTYRTVGTLQVAQRLPEPEAVDVNPSSAIVTAFNHPVVALGAEPADLPAAFHLQPEAPGRGEWLNTSTYIFYPEPPLAGGQSYTVQVEPTLHGTDGNPLETSEAWSFTTTLPDVAQTSPMDGTSQIWIDTPIILTFNQPMDAPSVEAGFRLESANGSPVPGTFKWNELSSEASFQPADLLERNQRYTVSVGSQAHGQSGTPIIAEFRGQFRTLPDLRVVSSEPAQGGVMPLHSGIRLRFSAPIDEQSASKYISIQPEVRNFNTSYFFDQETLTLYFYATLAPSTDYKLAIAPELADRWGGQLGQEFTLDFRSAPTQPGVYIGAGGVTHFVTANDASLSAQTSGLTSLPISLGSVPPGEAIKMLGPNGFDVRRSYQPADERSWGQPLNGDPDKAEPVEIYLSPEQQPLSTGFYLLSFDIPENYSNAVPAVVLVSNVNLLLKISATDALAWAVDLRTNTPVAGAPVSIIDEDGSLLAAGFTDEQGALRTPIPTRSDPYREAFAQIGLPGDETFAFSHSSWQTDVEPWLFNLNTDRSGSRQQIYFYTDRPIYRPGQTVYFRGVVRKAYNGRYEASGLKNVPVKMYDGNGRELAALDLPTSAFDTIHGEFKLADNAVPGYYSLSNPDLSNAYISFQVAEYRKPEINLQAAFSAEQTLIGKDLQASVEARYFFDAPAGNVPVTWALYATPAFFDLPGYQVGLQGAENLTAGRRFFGDALGESVLEGQGETNPDGTLQLTFDPPAVEQPAGRLRYTLEVTAQDESGLPVSTRATILANPAEYYIGLKSDSWVQRAGEPAGFDVQTADWQGQLAGEHALRARFDLVTWVLDESTPSAPDARAIYIPSLTPVASADLRTGADGRARLEFTPPEPGTYQLSVTGLEAGGAPALSEILLWASGPGQFTNPDLAARRLRLVSGRQVYQPGETAEVFIPNSLASEAQMLITTERSTILSYQVQTIPPGGATLSFPLSADDAPNIFISATLVGENAQELADFRQGYIELQVEPQAQTLDVQIISQPARAGPGETIVFEIQVRDTTGQPVEGEFSLAVVDLAALALADPNSLDIVSAFYAPQPLGVATGQPLAIYAKREVNLYPPGGGGGGGDGGIPIVRERFPDIAFWQADIVTGPDGKATLSVPLPDTLTTWQVETRGLTADTRVGQAETRIVTSKDLIVRPVTPRFMVVGDHVQLAAIVQNNTAHDLPVAAALEAQGFALDDPDGANQAVVVPANGRARLNWWGRALDQPQADLIFSARAEDAQGRLLEDAARPALGALPILRYLSPQTYRTAGVLDEAGEQLELVSLPRFFDPQTMDSEMNRLEVELSPSLAAAMSRALDVLENYPYACTEQTISRFLPNLETYRALRQFGIDSPAVQERLERTLDEGLQSLLASQNYDGGWGWWPAGPNDGQASDPFITAYVLYGLSRARLAGSILPEQSLRDAANYLAASFTEEGDVSRLKPLPGETWQLGRLVFELFALASAEESPPAAGGQGAGQPIDAAAYAELFDRLYEVRSQLNPWAQALLALVYESQSPGSDRAHTLLSDLQTSAVRSAAGAHWELLEPEPQNMVSSISNSAIVVYSLAQRDPGSALLADAVRYLMANRQADQSWSSTYATAWTLMALTEVVKGTGELGGEFGFGAYLNNAPLLSGQAGGPEQLNPASASVPFSDLYLDAPNQLAIQRDDGPGRLYYSALLQVGRPVDQVQAFSQGMSVDRLYFPAEADCRTDECPPLLAAESGGMVTVRLTLTLPHDVHYLVLEDYIPAGTEILDTRLKTSQQGQDLGPEAGPPYNPSDPFADGWGWWLFHTPQVYDNHITWAADYLPAGVYELTYTLVLFQPGEYRVLPARAWQFYFPEVQGNSAGGIFEVR